MHIVSFILLGLVAAVAIARYGLPLWFANAVRVAGSKASGFRVRGEDASLARSACRALQNGIASRLTRPGGGWVARCLAASPEARPLMIEGAAFTQAALHVPTWKPPRSPIPADLQSAWAWPIHFGLGMWSATRFGRNYEEVLRLAQSNDAWHRYLCLDGYGFKFGLIDFVRQPRAVAHFHAIPGYYRRAAFQGLGRALYLAFMSDRAALFETIGEIAPDHDGDIIEGAAFSAAYLHAGRPHRAINLARAVPYEWRPNAHLGLVLGFRTIGRIDPAYLGTCFHGLPPAGAEAIGTAIRLSDEAEQRIRADHPVSGYGLWRESVAQCLEQGRVLEPVYADSAEEGRTGNKGLVF